MLNKKLFCRHRSESRFPRFILAKRGQAAKQKRRGAARIIVVFHTRSKRNLLYSRAAITMLTKRGFPSRPSLGFSFSIAQNPRSCNWTFIICAALRHVVLMRKKKVEAPEKGRKKPGPVSRSSKSDAKGENSGRLMRRLVELLGVEQQIDQHEQLSRDCDDGLLLTELVLMRPEPIMER